MSNPKADIRALAALARIEVSDAEVAKLEQELPSILAFVETIQKAGGEEVMHAPTLRNVMRGDSHPHESGIYTESLLAAAPITAHNRVVVKQVVSRKK